MTPMEKIVAAMRIAANTGTWCGLIAVPGQPEYVRRCTHTVGTKQGLIRFLLTRDEGHHSCGWWKNSDYQRCWHLSVSFAYRNGEPAPYDFAEAKRWAKLVFGDHLRWVWIEPPYSEIGKQRQVHHYRLFADPGWQPMKPRGEVYSKQFTEIGWKSFSELHGPKPGQFAINIMNGEAANG